MTAVTIDQDNNIGIAILDFSARLSCTPLCVGREVPSNIQHGCSAERAVLPAALRAAVIPVSIWWHR